MKTLLAVIALLLFTPLVYADQHSNEPEDAPNESDSTDAAEEESEGDDFYNYSKD